MTQKNGDRGGSTSTPGMSLERFAQLAEAYGADFDRWPEDERFAAISLAGRSEEARSLLADAQGLDYLLSRLGRSPAPSEALEERVASLGPERRGTVERSHSIGRARVSAAAMAGGGLFSALRSNALMMSAVLNVVLASALGGVWIASGPASDPAGGVAAIQGEFMETLLDDVEAGPGFDEGLGTPPPVDPGLVEFGDDPSDDFEIARWPENGESSIDDISSI